MRANVFMNKEVFGSDHIGDLGVRQVIWIRNRVGALDSCTKDDENGIIVLQSVAL